MNVWYLCKNKGKQNWIMLGWKLFACFPSITIVFQRSDAIFIWQNEAWVGDVKQCKNDDVSESTKWWWTWIRRRPKGQSTSRELTWDSGRARRNGSSQLARPVEWVASLTLSDSSTGWWRSHVDSLWEVFSLALNFSEEMRGCRWQVWMGTSKNHFQLFSRVISWNFSSIERF